MIIGIALILFVQAHNVYPQLLLGRLFFSLGGAAASTMVTAVLPAISAAQAQAQANGSTTAPPPHDRSHTASPSITSELTITPARFQSTPATEEGRPVEHDSYASTSRVAGFVGMFTGCGALIALAVFLPLPARFQDRGVEPDRAVKHSFYIVAGFALFLALWCFVGLRRLAFENSSKDNAENGGTVTSQFTSIGHNLRAAILAGFQRRDIALGYIGGFVARASSVGISLFIPLLVNQLFLDSHLCEPESSLDTPAGLPDIKRRCPQAYVLAAELTGICETVALVAAPIFGYASARISRRGLPMMVASAAGVIGYCLLPTQFDPDGAQTGKRAAAFIAVSLIGVSQIGAIVCSLGVLGSGVLAGSKSHDNNPTNAMNGGYGEREALLGIGASKSEEKLSLSQAKGSVAGIYSFYGGAAILILTKLGGSLFDTVDVGAPFYIMAVFNAVLFVACAGFGWKKTIAAT